ncbi:LysR family transcriptional regulator [Sphingomonas lenta]|uniref:DNA-binding transcriptional regulator OxyR n=1 Tax=Sphingomonas lenta TaxID=1141887 RepID=A0A2A2SHU6_9SPHN|nr:LysR family transcriptional regulator [Sphingomonas lenta]PAX08854.1 DNA-binding transcriptional regulator OxyR [Sphingomonas lenta]
MTRSARNIHAARHSGAPIKRPHATARQLQCFVALAQERGFTRAAKRLGVSQPTLSGQINALERATGEKLVERGPDVILTPAGRAVLEKSRDVLLTLREIDAIRDTDALSGTVRLGACPTIGPYLLPTAIAALHRDHPALRVHVREDMPAALARGLAAGDHDLLLAPVSMHESRFEVEVILRERLFLAVAADDPLANTEPAEATRLSGRPLLAFTPGHGMEACAAAFAEDEGMAVSWEGEGASLHAVGQMAAAGMGLALLPELFVRRAMRGCAGLVVRPLPDPKHGREIALVSRRGTGRTRVHRELTERFRTEAAGMPADPSCGSDPPMPAP